jgi:hypothetical protein
MYERPQLAVVRGSAVMTLGAHARQIVELQVVRRAQWRAESIDSKSL